MRRGEALSRICWVMIRRAVLLLLLGPLLAGAQTGRSPKDGPVLAAMPFSGSIRLDGRLDDAGWRQASLVATLVQQSPQPGAPTPYQTTVRVLITADEIYFGFDCIDPEPSKIAVHTMQRDGNLEGDDSVAVVLDTYGDKRTGYFFRVNAAGARADGLVSEPEHPRMDWDGIWDARTARTDHGWTAEIVVPSRTLSFTPELQSWGVNFERNIPRDRTVLRWAAPTLDAFFCDLSRAGTLTGVGALKQGLGLEVSPYAVGRMKTAFQEARRVWQFAPGADVTYRVTSQMAAVFTANTDFAETEVDSRQLNTTRFPLFFPERRAFFLEGANQYEFGLGLGTAFVPFFSRRIGLFQGSQIPINGGAKLDGRAGRWNIGMLDVQTRDTILPNSDTFVPGTNLFAGRVSYDMNQELRLGLIVTNGHPDGIRRNTLAGFDAVWRTSEFRGNKNLLVGAWTAFSAGDIPSGNRAGWGFKIDYPNDLWDCATSLNDFGEALSPGLGFLPRPGTRQSVSACQYKPRPSKNGRFGWVRQAKFQHRFTRVTNYRGQVESWSFFWAPLNVQMESGDRFEFNWVPTFEFLPEPFEITRGVAIPPGRYRFDRLRLEFQTSTHRWWEFGNTSWFGTFYSGRLLQQQNYLRFTSPRGAWQLGLNSEQNFGSLPQGAFIQRLWQVNGTYAFHPNLVLTNFVQYDTESRNLGNNMRLRWTMKPGNDLFIVWFRGWKHLMTSREDLMLLPESELLAVKLRWTFRW